VDGSTSILQMSDSYQPHKVPNPIDTIQFRLFMENVAYSHPALHCSSIGIPWNPISLVAVEPIDSVPTLVDTFARSP
jgi:hypothetical protein